MSRESSLIPTNLLSWPSCSNLLPDQKLILIWLWACPHLTCAGTGLLPLPAAAATLGLSKEAFFGGVVDLENVGLIKFDKSTAEVMICGWFRFHKFNSPVQKANLKSAIKKIQSDSIKSEIVEKSMTYLTTATSTATLFNKKERVATSKPATPVLDKPSPTFSNKKVAMEHLKNIKTILS